MSAPTTCSKTYLWHRSAFPISVFGLFSAGMSIAAFPAQALDLTLWDGEGDIRYSNDQVILTNAINDGSDDELGNFNLSGNDPASIDSLENFLDVPAGTLSLDSVEGSAILQQSLVANAGDIFKFDWNFLTNEGVESSLVNPDYAFIIIDDQPTTLASATSSFTPSNFFIYETGFNTYSRQFGIAGTYKVSIGLIDSVDVKSSSALILKNPSVTPTPVPTPTPTPNPPASIPEPSSLFGLLIAAGASLWLKRIEHKK
jgi:hypothetical protein